MVHSANNQLIELKALPVAKHYYIAYSGGMDSTALLHSLCQQPTLTNRLTAIHVNHNIQAESTQWSIHCQQQCKQLNIPLITASVQLDDHSEAACRQARQTVFRQHLSSKDCLLTAHHLNDQVETMLFRMLRGTGILGLTGMNKTTAFAHYKIHRPLLDLSLEQIKSYVQLHQLSYVNDPSNLQNHYKRNHIRNLLIPELEKYDPAAVQNIALTGQNLQNSHNLLTQLIGTDNPLDYRQFTDVDMLSAALYHWLINLKQTAPSHKRLTQFSADCLSASSDKNPELKLNGCRLVRWQQRVYALSVTPEASGNEISTTLDSAAPPLVLPYGQIQFNSTRQLVIPVTIKYQQTHERIQLDANGQHKKPKNLFQVLHIPPWQRKHLPYLYIDNELMAIGSDILSAQFKQQLSAYKAEYRWLSPQYLL